jgi:hypothetical protein
VQGYWAAHPEIEIGWFPPYAPELNPEEFCYGNVKGQMRNATPDTVGEIRQPADHGFAILRKRPDLLLNFFYLAGLKLKQLWSWPTP